MITVVEADAIAATLTPTQRDAFKRIFRERLITKAFGSDTLNRQYRIFNALNDADAEVVADRIKFAFGGALAGEPILVKGEVPRG